MLSIETNKENTITVIVTLISTAFIEPQTKTKKHRAPKFDKIKKSAIIYGNNEEILEIYLIWQIKKAMVVYMP